MQILSTLPFSAPTSAPQELSSRFGRSTFDGTSTSAWLNRPENANWKNNFFIKGCICAGFYPSILRVQAAPLKFVEVRGGKQGGVQWSGMEWNGIEQEECSEDK
jgi:hypothetical protein